MRKCLRTTAIIGLAVSMAWTGVLLAQERKQENQPPWAQDDYVRMPLAPEDQVYASITRKQIMQWVREIVAISYKSRDDGNLYWGRISGTKYETMTNEYFEAKFKALGLQDIHRKAFDLPPQFRPDRWEFSVTAAGGPARTFTSVLPALGAQPTPAAGLELQAVWAGMGSAADFVGRDVRGKAVFIHDIPSEASNRTATALRATMRAQDLGAAAVVLVFGRSKNWQQWQSIGGGVKLPGFVMGYKDGMVVRDLLGEGKPVTVHMKLEARFVPGLQSTSVWGTMPGAGPENIIVMAHQDGYFEAANDNASGLAAMLALAEYYSKIPREKRRRTFIFMATAGHHVGSPNSAWMHENRATLLPNTALMINLEHIGTPITFVTGDQEQYATGMALRYEVNGSPWLTDLTRRTFRDFGIPTWLSLAGSGEMGHVKLDAPSVMTLRSPESKHSAEDLIVWIPEFSLEATTRAYAKIIDEVNRKERKELLPPSGTEPR